LGHGFVRVQCLTIARQCPMDTGPNILHGGAHLQGTLLAILSKRQALSAPAIAAA